MVVTITKGESIRRFFELAEDAEEEEDDHSMDKDGNELDGECSHSQKHAKSPELARKFLLDVATVIFKEQIEKAFREGTACQNAHSIFVCLALKLLEERVHVACKEITTLEKQMKLLEEVEKEKHEEEERTERRRTKVSEKKLRRKERLREKGREKRGSESDQNLAFSDVSKEESTPSIEEEPSVISNGNEDSINEAAEAVPSWPVSPDTRDEQFSNGYVTLDMKKQLNLNGELDVNVCSFAANYLQHSSRKMKQRKVPLLDSTLKWSDRQRVMVISENVGTISKSEPKYEGSSTSLRSVNGLTKQLRCTTKSNIRNGELKFGEKFHCFNNRMDRYDFNACSCTQHNDNRAKVELHSSVTRLARQAKSVTKLESASDMSKPFYHGNKYNQAESMHEKPGWPKNKITIGHNPSGRGFPQTKMIWEPMESHKKQLQSNSDSDVTLRSSNLEVKSARSDKFLLSSDASGSEEVAGHSVNFCHEEADRPGAGNNYLKGFQHSDTSPQYSKEAADGKVESSEATPSLNGPLDSSISNTSNSYNCSSRKSEGDSTTSSLNFQNPESSSLSDSEDASRHLEGREVSLCVQNDASDCQQVGRKSKQNIREESLRRITPDNARNDSLENISKTNGQKDDQAKENGTVGFQPRGMFSPLVNQTIRFPILQAPTVGYYHQNPVSWPTAPSNGLMPFPHPNHYVFASPLGYGYNGDLRFLQFGAVNHQTSPLLNPGHVPIFKPVSQINGMNPKEDAGILNQGKMKEASSEVNIQVVPKAELTMEAPKIAEGRQKDNSVKSEKENTDFSLFHFAGLIGLSTGDKLNPLVPEENVLDVSLKFSVDHGDGEQDACNKKDAIEEYNLFAASNGIRFSIF